MAGVHASDVPGTELPAGVRLRLLEPQDSMAEMTGLLHRAYGELAARGFRFHASHQDVEVTRKRCSRGECYVGVRDGQLVATVTLADVDKTGGSPWYDRPDVASVGQFAVEPRLQRVGVGSAMMDFVEHRAAGKSVVELALDTAEGATQLIDFYRKRGYRFIEYVQWEVTNYRSMVFSKTLRP